MSAYSRDDIKEVVSHFTEQHNPDDRYASYDYCFNYFNPANSAQIIDDMEKSCMCLGFYLASWGMFRGSSFLSKKSAKIFVPLIEYIASLNRSAWMIDANNLHQNHDEIIEIYKKIHSILIPSGHAHLTLTTKIMLGVFGSTPAFDRFFTDSFKSIFQKECGFTSFTKESLKCINEFYISNSEAIDQQAGLLRTTSFVGTMPNYQYTKSKIIDMYGFTAASYRKNKIDQGYPDN